MRETRSKARVSLPVRKFDAAIFDMDGVVTQTATLHAVAWKQLFDEYLAERIRRGETGFDSFNIDVDYRRYVDGRPRYDGVEAFLASRAISLPHGSADDSPDRETVCGLGNRKDSYFLAQAEREGVRGYVGTVLLIQRLRECGVKTGIFSASRHAETVLRAAGVIDLFDERIDGVLAEELGLPGKPSPAVLLELTRRLQATPSRTVVFEDAIAGVQAGRAGHFGLVVGVNRGAGPGTLIQQGADVEVGDLDEAEVVPR
jgi:alpha,alpha-trehalase